MKSHARFVQSTRHTRKTLYLVAGFYVAVGIVMAVASAVQGDRLGTFLGFLIVSGALAIGLLFRVAIHLGLSLSAMREGVDDLRRRLERLDEVARHFDSARREKAVDASAVPTNLSAVGPGDPSILAAATLDRDVYPRLVKTMEADPPAQSSAATSHVGASSSAQRGESGGPSIRADIAFPAGGLATKDLLQQWKAALREGDLSECRLVLSAMIDTAGEDSVAPLRAQIEELATRIEQSLREEFAACIRVHDYAGAVRVGERMAELIPDRPVVAQFTALRPLLVRRAIRGDQPASAARAR